MIWEENSSGKVQGDWNKEVGHYAIVIVQVNNKAPETGSAKKGANSER